MNRLAKLAVVVLVFALLGTETTAWALDISVYGGQPDGTDTTPALTAAVAAAHAGPDRTIHFWAGEYAFLTPPPALSGGVQLVGEGKFNTKLTRHYSNAEFFVGYGNGLGFRNLALWTAPGTSGGIALHLIASDAVGRGGKHVIEDVRILAGSAEPNKGTFALPLYLDGAARLTPPIGIRAVTLRNMTVFGATWHAVQWWNCIACEWFGGGVYMGSGTTESVVIGGPLAQKNYVEADINWTTSTVSPSAIRGDDGRGGDDAD